MTDIDYPFARKVRRLSGLQFDIFSIQFYSINIGETACAKVFPANPANDQSGPVCGPRRVNCASLRSGRGRPALGSPRAVFVIGQSGTVYTRSIMNVSRARFNHSRQNGTLAESRSEEGSLTGSSAQPDTWRIPNSSPPLQPGTHTDRAITARGEGPRPAVFRPICCVSVQSRDGWGGGGGPFEGFASN